MVFQKWIKDIKEFLLSYVGSFLMYFDKENDCVRLEVSS